MIHRLFSQTNQENFSKLFYSQLQKEHDALLAIEHCKKITKGNLWIVGGYISACISSALYGTNYHSTNIDVVCEESNIDNTEGQKTFFNHPKIKIGEMTVDIWPLKELRSIVAGKLAPTIESYLATVPLTMQSIAWDCYTESLKGDIGVQALSLRQTRINNNPSILFAAERKKWTVEEYAHSKADKINFDVIF